jgi:hypothetical protein
MLGGRGEGTLVVKVVGAGAPLRRDPGSEVSWFRGVTEERPALR